MDDMNRKPGEPLGDWKARRDGLARQLSGLGDPPAEDGVLDALASEIANLKDGLSNLGDQHSNAQEIRAGQLAALASRVTALEKAADPELMIRLEDRPGFVFCQSDQFALTMAAMVAMRGGEADLILKGGTVIEKLRMGEIAEVARQALTAGGGDASS